MTDEEMAEEWVNDNCCDLCVCQDECEIGCILCGAKDGFLTGLKAGRPQWHDLEKDPKDLPKDKEYVLVYTNLTNYYVAEKVDDHFMSKGWGFIPMSTVIAWCEIPTFDKE